MRHIGVMGGAFNPIHTRHLMVAQKAMDQFGLEKVIFVPSGNPPHKKTGMLDKELRFAMVVAAISDNPRFEASRLEIDRVGESWTIDTLKELQRLYGQDVCLNFIMGEDNVSAFKTYERRVEFFALCRLLVSPRRSADPQLVATWRQILPEADIEAIDCPANDCSSTLVRTWICNGHSVRYMVPSAVLKIIEDNGYYKEGSLAAGSSSQLAARFPESDVVSLAA